MKKLIIIPALLTLSACADNVPPPRCMTAEEAGTIKDSKDWTEQVPGLRGGSYEHPHTTVLVEVKGLVRVCEVDEHAAAMLQPGTKVSLINAERKF